MRFMSYGAAFDARLRDGTPIAVEVLWHAAIDGIRSEGREPSSEGELKSWVISRAAEIEAMVQDRADGVARPDDDPRISFQKLLR